MENQNCIQRFIIPKMHKTNTDVLISENSDSRNVKDLFNDIKSCAFQPNFNFRESDCTSCDTIHNPKLQKLYNERRTDMKKGQEPVERLAFHLITSCDIAKNIANNGIDCKQLKFPIDKYLGNPEHGVHLSKRPDIVLASATSHGIYRSGLFVFKILLGKGYATIPSQNNKQFCAQLNYDHHTCPRQLLKKEQTQIDDLLAETLVFCYQYKNFETVSHPSQILPIAIIWYKSNAKFSWELISKVTVKSLSNNVQQQKCGDISDGRISKKKKHIQSCSNDSLNNSKISTLENTKKDELVSKTYPNHCFIPYQRCPSNNDQICNSRDPRLLKSSEAIQFSSLNLNNNNNDSLLFKHTSILCENNLLIEKKSSLIHIPFESSTTLNDPRLESTKHTRIVAYLELKSVEQNIKHQKRLKYHYNSKNALTSKTSYKLIPFILRKVSQEEYERLLNIHKTLKSSKPVNEIDCASLYIPVIDCCNFGLLDSIEDGQICIDLDIDENRIACEQIELSNQLIEHERQLNSRQIRLNLREKRQKKLQHEINRKMQRLSTISSSEQSKSYILKGRQLLKEHQVPISFVHQLIPSDLLSFLSAEYRNETRTHVKYLLAELAGILTEKYKDTFNQIENHKHDSQTTLNCSSEDTTLNDRSIVAVVDMDIESPPCQVLHDRDERFQMSESSSSPYIRIQVPTNEIIYTKALTSLIHTQNVSDKSNNNRFVEQLNQQYQQMNLKPSSPYIQQNLASILSIGENVVQPILEKQNLLPLVNMLTKNDHTNSNHSRAEFVELLTGEIHSKPANSVLIQNKLRDSKTCDELLPNVSSETPSTSTSLRCQSFESNINDSRNKNSTSTDNRIANNLQEPLNKRIKIEPTCQRTDKTQHQSNVYSNSNNNLSTNNQHDNRKTANKNSDSRSKRKTKRSSRSRSTSVDCPKHKSLSGTRKRSKEKSSRSPSNNHRHYSRTDTFDLSSRHYRKYSSSQISLTSPRDAISMSDMHDFQRDKYNDRSVSSKPRVKNENTLLSSKTDRKFVH